MGDFPNPFRNRDFMAGAGFENEGGRPLTKKIPGSLISFKLVKEPPGLFAEVLAHMKRQGWTPTGEPETGEDGQQLVVVKRVEHVPDISEYL